MADAFVARGRFLKNESDSRSTGKMGGLIRWRNAASPVMIVVVVDERLSSKSIDGVDGGRGVEEKKRGEGKCENEGRDEKRGMHSCRSL